MTHATRPRAATAFEVHSAALPQLLKDLRLGFRPLLDGRELGFELLAEAVPLGPDLSLRSEGGMLPGNLGGYAELEVAPSAPADASLRLTVRLSQGRVDANVVVQLDYVRPAHLNAAQAQALDVLAEVIARWGARYKLKTRGGALLSAVVRTDTAQRYRELADEIIDPDNLREVCLVVVTEQFRDRSPACDVHALATRLMGFAVVCVLSQDYTRPLTEQLGGKPYGVYDGAVRVYQPNYRPDHSSDAYEANPLLLGDDVRRLVRAGTFEERVFDLVQERQAGRFLAPRPDFKQIRRLLTTQRFSGAAEGEPAMDLLEARLAYADALGVIEELRERITALERALAGAGPEVSVAPAPQVALDELLVQSFLDVPKVRVWTSAIESAAACGPHQYVFSTVTRALEAVAEYARTLAARPDFQLGQQPYHWFRTRGMSYKATESPTTLALHGKDRQWTEAGVTCEVQSHVTLNPNTDRCVQLYFDADPKARKVNVVYLGPHLPTATQTHNN